MRGIVGWAQRNGLFFALLILVAFFATRSDRYLTRANLHVILLQVAVVGIIAVPGAMLLLAGYVDLAVGSIAVLAAIVFGELMTGGLGGAGRGGELRSLSGSAWGLATGYLVAYLGFSPVVVTLGGLAGARGLAEIISKGFTKYGFGKGFAQLGNGDFLGIDTPVWILATVLLLGAYAWYQTPLGRHITAIGAERVAAHSLGVATRRIPFLLYGASGLAAALGGLIVTSQLDGASLSIGSQAGAVGAVGHPARRRLLPRRPRLALRRAPRRPLHRRARQRSGPDERRPLLPARRRRPRPRPRRRPRHPLPAARPHPDPGGAGAGDGGRPRRLAAAEATGMSAAIDLPRRRRERARPGGARHRQALRRRARPARRRLPPLRRAR